MPENKQALLHKNHEQVDRLLSMIQDEDICYASVGVIKGQTIYSAFSNDKWKRFYVEQNLHLNDPTFQAAINVPELPIFWDCVSLYTEAQIDVMRKRSEMVGAKGGVTICFEAADKKLLITFGTSAEGTIINVATRILKSLNVPDILQFHLNLI